MVVKIIPAPDEVIINLDLTLGQIRLLFKLAEIELREIEIHGEFEQTFKETYLQGLVDVLGEYTHIPRTPEVHQA
jgi:hypothetical protein